MRHLPAARKKSLILLVVLLVAVGGILLADSSGVPRETPRERAANARIIAQANAYQSQQKRAAEHLVALKDIPPPLTSVLTRLNDRTRPFTILILGDSTGISRYGWQVLAPAEIGRAYRRTTVLHPWSGPAGYPHGTYLLNRGPNAKITVWNGSAGGADIAYTEKYLPRMAPVAAPSVDLIIINQGHNEQADKVLSDMGTLVQRVTSRFRNAAVIVTEQNPDEPDFNGAANQAAIVESVAKWAQNEHLPVVDAYSPIEDSGHVGGLLNKPSEVHPDAAGYRVWAKALENLLAANGRKSERLSS
jgi:lysophospholipase L1-like esterase